MTEQDVLTARHKRFHVANNPVRTIEDARKFLNDVGFCLVYPLRHAFPAPLPSFMAAFVGTTENIPYQHIAFADPRAKEATELMVRLLRAREAFEVDFHEDSALLVSAELFPYYYALVGQKGDSDLTPKLTGSQAVSNLALDIYRAIEKHGAVTKSQLRDQYLNRGASISDAGMDRALHELWATLKITRTDYSPEEGSRWDLLSRWAKKEVNLGARINAPMALSAVISRYLQGVVAAEEREVEEFISRIATRRGAVETFRALIATREIRIVAQGDEGRSFFSVSEQAPSHPVLAERPAAKKPPRKQQRPRSRPTRKTQP